MRLKRLRNSCSVVFLLLLTFISEVISKNGHGLLRSSINGIFYPVNHTNNLLPQPLDKEDKVIVSTVDYESSTTINTEDGKEDDSQIIMDPDYEIQEDLNKTKRSKAAIRWVKKLLGFQSTGENNSQRYVKVVKSDVKRFQVIVKDLGIELEAQMVEDDAGAGEQEDLEVESATTAASVSILSKLNPINKISYKVTAARNAVSSVYNKVTGVIGIGGGSGSSPPEDGGGEGGDAFTGDSSGGGDDGADSSGVEEQQSNYLSVILFSFFVAYFQVL